MGGGKKKPTLSQMAKAQRREEGEAEGKSKKSSGTSPGTEKRTLRIDPPSPNDKTIIKDLQRMKVLTPYTVASRFNLRLSVAKDFLEELHRQGVITHVSRGRNVRIYKPSEPQ